MKPRALDLFCGAGGASTGLALAGFDVIGVDVARQPRYPFQFVQGDALQADLRGFDFIWASPPCQRYSMASRNIGTAHRHPDLLPDVRRLLERQSSPWVIENVPGAPMRASVILCGTMFGRRLLRHRLFEASFPISELLHPCDHRGDEIPVYGNGTPSWHRARRGPVRITEKRAAMGIDWMNRRELSEAIPPAYSEFIGRAALAQIRRVAA